MIDPTTSLEALAKYSLINLTDSDFADLAKVDPTWRCCATSTGVAVHSDVALQAMFAGQMGLREWLAVAPARSVMVTEPPERRPVPWNWPRSAIQTHDLVTPTTKVPVTPRC